MSAGDWRPTDCALLVIDVQNDFLPGGSLSVPGGDEIIPVVNSLLSAVDWAAVVYTQDWHPSDHASFAANNPGAALFSTVQLPSTKHSGQYIDQVMWPAHCVQDTHGAAFHADLQLLRDAAVVRKGTDRSIDSYSGFFDNEHAKKTDLEAVLRAKNVTQLCLVGLALDYCVAYTAIDACGLGFRCWVLEDACRGIAADSMAQARQKMTAAGVVLSTSDQLLAGQSS